MYKHIYIYIYIYTLQNDESCNRCMNAKRETKQNFFDRDEANTG